MGRNLDGKVAVVTGAGGGLGAAYARALGLAGAQVVLADIDEPAAGLAAKELAGAGIECLVVRTDVTSEESTQAMATAAVKQFGGIDILVNNAALMAEIPKTGVTDLDLEIWDRVLRVNLWAPCYFLASDASDWITGQTLNVDGGWVMRI